MKRFIGMSILMALFIFGLQLAPSTDHGNTVGATDSMISMTDFGPSIASAGTFATNLATQWQAAETVKQNFNFGNPTTVTDPKTGVVSWNSGSKLPEQVQDSIQQGGLITNIMGILAGW